MRKEYSPFAKYKLYKMWLEGYKKKGGKVKCESGYDRLRFDPDEWIIVDDYAVITPRYGVKRRKYLVLPGAKVRIEGLGHNEVYYLKDFSTTESVVREYEPPDRRKEIEFRKRSHRGCKVVYPDDISVEDLVVAGVLIGVFSGDIDGVSGMDRGIGDID